MLIAKLQEVSSEKDSWKNGCTGEHFVNYLDLEFKAENEKELIDKITSHFRVTVEHLLFNSCDEVGRLELQLQTREKFDEFQLTSSEFEEFRMSDIQAYLTTFSFQVFEQLSYNLVTRSS